MPPTGSTRPRSEISPVIADRAARAAARERRDDRGRERDARRGAVLRHRAGRHVQVDLAGARAPRAARPSASAFARTQRERGLGRLAHHVAELAGEAQPHALAAGQRGRLDEEDVAAVARCAARPDDDARHAWCARRVSGRCGGAPSASATKAASMRRGRGAPARRCALGDARARPCAPASRCWRSRLRTPASRVYSWTTRSIASSVERRPARPRGRAPRAASAPGSARAIASLSRSV